MEAEDESRWSFHGGTSNLAESRASRDSDREDCLVERLAGFSAGFIRVNFIDTVALQSTERGRVAEWQTHGT